MDMAGDPDYGGLAADLGRARKFLTAAAGLRLRSGGAAPAVEGRGAGAGARGPRGGGAGLRGGSGLGHRLRARWRMRCRKARGRAAVLPSESRCRTPASSDRTPRSTGSERRWRPGLGLPGALGWGLRGPGSSSSAGVAPSSSFFSSFSCSSGSPWGPASGPAAAAGRHAGPHSGLTSKSQAGGADAVPGASHRNWQGPRVTASTQKRVLLSRPKSCCREKAA